LNSVFGFEKVDRWDPIRTSAIQSRSWRRIHCFMKVNGMWRH